ncbi:MAG: bacillithiol biosynthesis cysteine-adding enzyme BshC, partial [Salinimicrobium sediminis]|nr:bacillithiol biosynthesis cysteine-adding enzyme BshC [Salinimicrobium sediminis]
MHKNSLAYRDTNYFTPLVTDYLDQKENVQQFYGLFPTLENFQEQIAIKKENYDAAGGTEKREVLTGILKEQYRDIKISEATASNFDLLKEETTFTVTTGHQLNLFTGPLYFLYKIVSAINLARDLKKAYPQYNFVPVYWMATEDHDFEEISFFYLHGKKFQWNPPKSEKTGGPVGELPTTGLNDVFELFSAEIGNTKNAGQLKQWFKKAYLEHDNLADATRYLANELFGEQGLVIMDAHHAELKRLYIPQMKKELLDQVSYKAVQKKSETLEQEGYNVQVNTREINLFYIQKGLRERIIEKNGKFFVHENEISWSKEELLELLENHPERFSPNVLLRPLYEEVILPNLCYIGGGGELAYWLELKGLFEAVNITFPVLLLRNS